ncbi:MAG: solute carrier family 23 protein [Candidatus Competibacteraceae bacterium]
MPRATLVVVSSLAQFLFSARLGLLRRIVTPTVGGTAIMLIAVTIFPICFKMLGQVPANVTAPSPTAAPITALIAFAVIVGISLFTSGAWRLWGPLIGVICGCLAAQWYNIIDWQPFLNADWIGFPDAAWPGLDLSFGTAFWLLLPSFILVTIVSAIETYGDGIAIQHVSRRKEAPVDYKSVQGAVNADGLGNLLSGLAGTLPNTTYSTSVAVVDMTGVAARRVGWYGGLFLLALAFSPKISALLQAVPPSVAGVYIVILLVMLFAHGLKLVTEDGLSYENGFVVGLAFWLGVGFQNQLIYTDLMPVWLHSLLDNGMTAGSLVALALTFILSLRARPQQQLILPAAPTALPLLHDFARRVGLSVGWEKAAIQRLELITEEALLFLLDRQADQTRQQQILVQARTQHGQVELEFASGARDANLEQLLAQVKERQAPEPDEVGLRILKRLTRQIRHQQFHDGDFLIMRVDGLVE